MNTILYASLSANGRVIFAEDVKHQTNPEVVADFMQLAASTRNLIIGKTTFELLLGNPMVRQAFEGIEIIVLSKKMPPQHGITMASSPAEAIQYCIKKGYKDTLVIGGAQVYQSFLTQGLINDLVLNLMPMITAGGGALTLPGAPDLQLTLLETKKIASEITQLRYRMRP